MLGVVSLFGGKCIMEYVVIDESGKALVVWSDDDEV